MINNCQNFHFSFVLNANCVPLNFHAIIKDNKTKTAHFLNIRILTTVNTYSERDGVRSYSYFLLKSYTSISQNLFA